MGRRKARVGGGNQWTRGVQMAVGYSRDKKMIIFVWVLGRGKQVYDEKEMEKEGGKWDSRALCPSSHLFSILIFLPFILYFCPFYFYSLNLIFVLFYISENEIIWVFCIVKYTNIYFSVSYISANIFF